MGSDDDEIELARADDDETDPLEPSDDDDEGHRQNQEDDASEWSGSDGERPSQEASAHEEEGGERDDDDDDEHDNGDELLQLELQGAFTLLENQAKGPRQQGREDEAGEGSGSDGERANQEAPAHDEEGEAKDDDDEHDDGEELTRELAGAFARVESQVDAAPRPQPQWPPPGVKINRSSPRRPPPPPPTNLPPKGPPAAIPDKLPPQLLPLPFDDRAWSNRVVTNHHHHHVYIWSPHAAVEEAASPDCHVIPTHGLRNNNLDYSHHRHASLHACKHLPMHVTFTYPYVMSRRPGHANMPCVKVASFVAGTTSAVHVERSTGQMHFTHQFVHYHCIHFRDMWAQSPGARSASRRTKQLPQDGAGQVPSRVCVKKAFVTTETKTATSCRPLGPVGEFIHHHTHFHTFRIYIKMDFPNFDPSIL